MTLELVESEGRRLYTLRDGPDPLGFIVIDSTVGGRSRGGLRMLPDVSLAEVRDAARTMTLKYGFLGLPQGGAKAGVLGDGEAPREEKLARLSRFAAAARTLLLARAYVPDADLGTRSDEIREMMRAIGARIGRREWQGRLSGYYTALSTFLCARQAARSRGHSLDGWRVAVEGFGSVGSALARLLAAEGARVVAVSSSRGAIHDPDGLDVEAVVRLAQSHGSDFVRHWGGRSRLDRAALLELPVDLLCPCARRHGIDAANAERVRAQLICSGANDPVAPSAESRLAARGTLVLPDFVTNSGGVLGGTLEFAGFGTERVRAAFERFYPARIDALLTAAREDPRSLRAIAEGEALERHRRVRRLAENPSPAGRLLDLGLSAYRRGWIPSGLVALLAPIYLRRRLGGP